MQMYFKPPTIGAYLNAVLCAALGIAIIAMVSVYAVVYLGANFVRAWFEKRLQCKNPG